MHRLRKNNVCKLCKFMLRNMVQFAKLTVPSIIIIVHPRKLFRNITKWSEQNPGAFAEMPLHPLKITVQVKSLIYISWKIMPVRMLPSMQTGIELWLPLLGNMPHNTQHYQLITWNNRGAYNFAKWTCELVSTILWSHTYGWLSSGICEVASLSWWTRDVEPLERQHSSHYCRYAAIVGRKLDFPIALYSSQSWRQYVRNPV